MINIKKIEIPTLKTAKEISKSIPAIFDFHLKMATELNRVIDELSEINVPCDNSILATENSDLLYKIEILEKKLKSNKNALGTQIDIIEQRLNKLLGSK